jgi:hypothetical protein
VTAVNPLAGSISFVVITENNVRDCDAILEVLSLGKHPIDDVIVLTRSDRVSEINTADRPWCRVIGISDASIYSLRAVIPTISQNDWLVVLEEHSLVTIATLDAIRSTIQNQSDIDLIVFLGKNLTSVSPWGWANFLHTFALIWAPIDEPPPFSPVTSVIVRRAALQTDCAFREGEWELRTIPQIFARGRIAYSNDICVDHIRRLTIISCFLINYHNARAGAGIGRGLGRSVRRLLVEGWCTFYRRPSQLARARAARWSELPPGTLGRIYMVGLIHLIGTVVGTFFGPGQSVHKID